MSLDVRHGFCDHGHIEASYYIMERITSETTIEDLVTMLPASVSYLMEKGIKCIACGEPIWGTLESAAKEKGFGEEEIRTFITELNILVHGRAEGDR